MVTAPRQAEGPELALRALEGDPVQSGTHQADPESHGGLKKSGPAGSMPPRGSHRPSLPPMRG